MKKQSFKTFSIFLYRVSLSLLVLVAASCSEDELTPAENIPEIESVEYVAQTEDKLAVLSDLPAYIFPYEYKGFGAALVNRLSNKIADYKDYDERDSLATIVLHSSQIQTFDGEIATLVYQLIHGNNIVIVEPTIQDFKKFCKEVTLLYMLMTDFEENLAVLHELDMMPGVRQTFDTFKEMCEDESKIESMFLSQTDSKGVFAEAIAIRGSHFHIVDRMKGVADTETTYEIRDTITDTLVPTNEPVTDQPVSGAQDETITPYTYGLFADMFTQWINEQEQYVEDMEEARTRGLNTFNTRSETQKLSLEDICTVQKVEYTMYAAKPLSKYGVGNSQPVSVRFEICSVHQDGKDYYCIYKRITSYNQYLNCGPTKDREWYTHKDFYYKVYTHGGVFGVSYGMYGPFMRNINSKSIVHAETDMFKGSQDGIVDITDNTKIDRIQSAKIENYSPRNDIGSSDVSHGFSKGFDAGLYLAKEPALNLGFSFSWDTSTSRTVSDLELEASSLNGIAKWDYTGQNLPIAYYNLFKSPSKKFAPEIMRRECMVDQSWIWEIPNPQGSYRLYDETTITNTILYYKIGGFKCIDNYANQETTKRISFHMPAPPRYQQRWTMHMEPNDKDDIIRNLHEKFWDADSKEFKLPDESMESRTAINDFIGSFKQEIEKKRLSWIQNKLFGTYKFKYINFDNSDVVEFSVTIEEPSEK